MVATWGNGSNSDNKSGNTAAGDGEDTKPKSAKGGKDSAGTLEDGKGAKSSGTTKAGKGAKSSGTTKAGKGAKSAKTKRGKGSKSAKTKVVAIIVVAALVLGVFALVAGRGGKKTEGVSKDALLKSWQTTLKSGDTTAIGAATESGANGYLSLETEYNNGNTLFQDAKAAVLGTVEYQLPEVQESTKSGKVSKRPASLDTDQNVYIVRQTLDWSKVQVNKADILTAIEAWKKDKATIDTKSKSSNLNLNKVANQSSNVNADDATQYTNDNAKVYTASTDSTSYNVDSAEIFAEWMKLIAKNSQGLTKQEKVPVAQVIGNNAISSREDEYLDQMLFSSDDLITVMNDFQNQLWLMSGGTIPEGNPATQAGIFGAPDYTDISGRGNDAPACVKKDDASNSAKEGENSSDTNNANPEEQNQNPDANNTNPSTYTYSRESHLRSVRPVVDTSDTKNTNSEEQNRKVESGNQNLDANNTQGAESVEGQEGKDPVGESTSGKSTGEDSSSKVNECPTDKQYTKDDLTDLNLVLPGIQVFDYDPDIKGIQLKDGGVIVDRDPKKDGLQIQDGTTVTGVGYFDNEKLLADHKKNIAKDIVNGRWVMDKSWVGSYRLSTGKTKVNPQLGDGTLDNPASVGTSVLYTQGVNKDGKVVDAPIRVQLSEFRVGGDAIKWYEDHDARNRGFDVRSNVVQVGMVFTITNLSSEKLTIHDDSSIADDNGNLASRTGTVYGLQDTVTLEPGQSGKLESWTGAQAITGKDIIWGASYMNDKNRMPVYFRVLALAKGDKQVSGATAQELAGTAGNCSNADAGCSVEGNSTSADTIPGTELTPDSNGSESGEEGTASGDTSEGDSSAGASE